jgi:transposase/signal recognition particle subunit SEC65
MTFKPYDQDQPFLLPPSLREWLPGNHLAYFISDVVDELSLDGIMKAYSNNDRGQPPYHPAMMVKVLFYAYCVGMPSSRKIEQKTYEDIALRFLSAGHHPDHDTIASFRRTHLDAIKDLFLQVLVLCREAGLVRAGHISLDGTKVKANASKHKAMSYVRMNEREEQLRREIDGLLKRADKTDTEEDSRYGRGNRNDDVPRELAFREERLRKIRQARATLEKRVREEKDKNNPSPKDQTNFTDPASRIMKDSATKEFIQGYNAQCAVDDTVQVIVAAGVTTEANDKRQVEPMIVMIEENLGCLPKELSADAGYFSEENIAHLHARGIRALIPPDRMKHTDTVPLSSRGRIPKDLSVKDRMRRLLRTKKGRSSYAKRKTIVEPVFGQIKEVRGLRRFLLRGLEKVTAEWQLICLTHNLLKLYRWKVAKIPV